MADRKPKSGSRGGERWWSALKLVALQALARPGNTPFVTLCLTLLGALFIWKVDSEHLVRVIEVFSSSTVLVGSGWILAILAYGLARYQYRMHRNEIERLVRERDALQALLIPGMKSSNHETALIESVNDKENDSEF